MTITAESLWRKGAETFPFSGVTSIEILNSSRVLQSTQSIAISGGGDTTTLRDTSDANFDLRRQQFTIDLSNLGLSQGEYFLRFESNNRIAGIVNAPEGFFSLEVKVIFDGTANGSPVMNSSFITAVGRGFEYSQNLNASDPEGTSLSYAFLVGATSPDFGPSSQIPGITLSTSGLVLIPGADTQNLLDNTASEPGGDYVFKIVYRG